jgi:iron complex transport system permease protein
MTPMSSSEAESAYFKRFARWKLIVLILILALILTMTFAITVGPVPISPIDVYKIIIDKIPFIGDLITSGSSSKDAAVVMLVRLPRVLGAALVGIALAVAGVVLQGLFRNPMADPYLIGISAGASVGASLSMAFGIGLSFFGVLYSVPLMAFIFAIGTVFLVYTISRTGEEVPMSTLLLVGIAVNSFLMAITAIIRLLAGEAVHAIMTWMFGSLNLVDWNYVEIALPFVVVGVALIYVFARDLNIMLLGEEQAHHLGVNTERLKKILLASATLMTAAAVSISGIIGFVGLIIPHIARILVGPDHRILIPSSALTGAIVLILCDTAARTVVRPMQLPVGIITALLGAPFFIYLVRRKKRSVIR